MMEKPHLLPREQKLALVAIVVILVWVVMSWVGLPLVDRFKHLEQKAFLARRKLTRLSELAGQRPAIEQAYQAYAVYRTDKSDESVQSAFLSELEELTRQAGLQLSLKPRPIQQDGHVSRVGVELDVDATQEALLGFLDRLLSWPSLIELTHMRISSTPSREHPLKAILVVNRVIVRP